MNNKKLISVRINPDVLQLIDEFCTSRPYLTRSAVIASVLENVMTTANEDTKHLLTTTMFAYNKGFITEFRKDSDTLKERAKKWYCP